MSGLDLYEAENSDRLSKLTPTDTIAPGVFEGFIRGTGMETMRQFARTGRAIGMAGSIVPIVQDAFTGGTTAQDRYFKELDERVGSAVRAWTPEPNEVGVAGQVTGTLLSMLPMVMANPALALANMGLGLPQDLIEQYGEEVSAGKAVVAGTAMNAGLGLGIWMPIMGRSLFERVLIGGAGFNVIQGAAMRKAANLALQGTPAAKDFEALNGIELTIDLLLGAGFGAIAHLSPAQRAQGKKAWDTLEAWGKGMSGEAKDALLVMRGTQHTNVDTLPGTPTSPEAMNTHVEKVKTAIDQTLRGEPVNVDNVGVREETPASGTASLPDSLIAQFPDMPTTVDGLIALNALRPDEAQAIRDAGLVTTAKAENGSTYEGVDPEVLWAERKIRQSKKSTENKGITDEEWNNGVEKRAAIYDRLADEQDALAGLGDTAKAAEYRQKAAEIRQSKRQPDFEPIPERFTEAHEFGMDLQREAERIRAEEGLPPVPEDPRTPSKIYTATKEALEKIGIGERFGADYVENAAKVRDAFYKATAKIVGETADKLFMRKAAQITKDAPSAGAMLEQRRLSFAKAAEVWKRIAGNKEAFRYAASESPDPQQIVKDMGLRKLNITVRSNPGDNEIIITRPVDGVLKEARLGYDDAGQAWLDIADSKPGFGGDAVYQFAMQWAKNNDRIFIGDPAGVSPIAVERRTEQMVSAALRLGTTKHMRPDWRQEINGWRDVETIGDEADLSNMALLLRKSYDNVKRYIDKIDDFRYDFDRGIFTDLAGNPVPKSRFTGLADEARAAVPRRPGTPDGAQPPSFRGSFRDVERAIVSRSAAELAEGRNPLLSVRGGPLEGVLNQDQSPRWYSELTRQVEGLKQNVAPAAQWKATIKGLKGVKAEEMEWTGLNEWLTLQETPVIEAKRWQGARFEPYIDTPGYRYGKIVDADGRDMVGKLVDRDIANQTIEHNKGKPLPSDRVTRQQILDYLNSNGVKVDEVMKGEPGPGGFDVIQREFEREGYGIERDPGMVGEEGAIMYSDRDGEYVDFEDLPDNLQRVINENTEGGGEPMGATKFGSSSLQLPGAKPGSYRELLLTLPTEKRGAISQKSIDGINASLKRRGMTPLDEEQITALRGGMSEAFEMLDDIEARFDVDVADARAEISGADASGTQAFTRSHWEEPNVLAHVRFNERTDADGKRVLFVEEIQSDWAQKGKKEGFVGNAEIVGYKWDADAKDWVRAPDDQAEQWGAAQLDANQDALWESRAIAEQKLNRNGIPTAPFVGKTDAWAGLVIKRMIRYAAENGFDRVAWTRGEQQVERYTNALRQVVDRIEWEKTPEGVQILGYKGKFSPGGPTGLREQVTEILRQEDNLGFDTPQEARQAILTHNDWTTRWDIPQEHHTIIENWRRLARNPESRAEKVVDTRYGENELSDAIGKTLAEQIKNDPGQKGVIEGQGIRVDDTGMAGFYDRIVPKIANDILKKLGGGKVAMADIPLAGKDGKPSVERGTEQPVMEPMTDRDGFEGAEDFRDGPPLQGEGEIIVNGQKIWTMVLADPTGVHFIGETPNGEQFDMAIRRDITFTGEAKAIVEEMWAEGRGGPWAEIEINSGSFEGQAAPSKQPSFDITPELKAKAMEGLPLFQGGDQPRGFYEFGPDQQSRIGLLETANKSTFIHEMGHDFLQIWMELSVEPNAPKALHAELEKIFKWFKVDRADFEKMTFKERTPYYEQWARGFEAFLREGRTSNPELTSAFQKFKQWLIEVYRSLTMLDVKLSDDIRGVMDRMLGGQREVDVGAAPETKSGLLADIKALGGIDKQAMLDVTGERRFGKGVKGIPWGLFKEGGRGLDDLATSLRDRGWPIPEDDVDGGVQGLKDLVKAELEGERAIRQGEEPTAKPQEEADAEQIMRDAADQEEAIAEKYDYRDTPEYRAEIDRVRTERDYRLAEVLDGQGDPVGAEARRTIAENPDMAITMGENVNGEGETMTAREYLDQAQAEYEQALKDVEMFKAAGDCMLGVD